ncbi:MAG: penicillin acylase family protein, partial [Pseudomonadota bacterium]
REETIGVRGAPDRDATFYRSVHGPIIRMDRGVGRAYAKQRGWAGRELETLAGWMEATKARSHKEWRKAVSKSALNVNWYFAGANGDIGYMFAGAYPKRHPEHDHRLPVSGEGAMDWRGVHPPSWNPQAINPPEGYFANWNNRPAADFPNPDMWWYSWSRADRVETLQKAIEAAGPLSADDAWALMMDASFVDPNARYFLPPLLEALASEGEASAASEQARAALAGWDGSFADVDEVGRYAAPAVAIFQTWLGQLLEDALGDDLPGAVGGAIAATTGYGTPDAPTPAGLNISVGLKLLFEAIEGRTAYDYFNGAAPADAMRGAFAKSVQELTARFGSDVANWRLPAPPIGFKTSNFLGVPQATAADKPASMREMNRGTENNMTLFVAGEARGWEVTPPGQSGFVAPDGTRAAHFDDQMALFESLSRRRLSLKEDDVLADMTAETVLTPPRR